MQQLVDGDCDLPAELLGPHRISEAEVLVRTFQPYAKTVTVRESTGNVVPLDKVHEQGLFEGVITTAEPEKYVFQLEDFDATQWDSEDPYAFPQQLGELDLYLMGEGTHYRAHDRLGAHVEVLHGVSGVRFSIWAPNAKRVSVVGNFNHWDGRMHLMQRRESSGLWELFVPRLTAGDLYKFEIKGANGFLAQKADPYAFGSELRPRTASMVWEQNSYDWNDNAWMEQRKKRDWLAEPISVYEVHLGSWKRVPEEDNRFLSYREFADDLIPYLKEMGFTHVELLPVTEHPFDGSWGYQTMGYFSPTSRFGSPDDLKYFIDRCHQEGIGVIVDWVPAHFPKDDHGLAYFDGTNLYEHADPRKGEHMDWGTLIFNYGRHEVRSFLLSSAVFWADYYHVDGFRVDAVASMLYLDYSRDPGGWVPNEYGGNENLEAVDFIKRFNEIIHAEYPGIVTFAEESTAWPMVSRPTYAGGLGFDLKWNMGWMHDTLEYFSKDPIHRKYHHGELTFSLLYAFNENFILPFSHDEVVHGKQSMLSKMPGDAWQKRANLRLLYTYMFMHPGKKLLFMGCEFGQWDEWSHGESLPWHLADYDDHKQIQKLLTDLNQLLKTEAALHQVDFSWEGFEWIDFHDAEQSTLSFLRKTMDGEKVVVLLNLTSVPREWHRVGLPELGYYQEIFNSDAGYYGGSNMGNCGGVEAEETPWNDRPYSAQVVLPPLAGVILKKSNSGVE